MISAEQLYRKIKATCPDLKLDKPGQRDFSYPDRPPLTEEELELLEAGFDIEPAYNYDEQKEAETPV